MRRPLAILLLLAASACGGGGGMNPGADGPGGDDATTGGTGLVELYAGPVARATVPDWDAAAPRPLVVEAYLATSTTWWVSIARISPAGAVSGIVADEVRIWGWADGADAPDQLASGPLATTRVPDWSASAPRPLVLGARQDGSQDWFVAMAKVHPDGALSELVVDDVTIWGWPTGAGPTREYDGALASAHISPWSADAPRPLVVLANQATPEWYVSLVGVDATGTVGGIVAETVEVYGF